jgi:hypothetical protein
MSENNIICNCGCWEDIVLLTPENTSNFPGLSALQYRVGTHYSFKQSMLNSIAKYPALNQLTTRDIDDFAVATLDAWATVLDVLSFYQERIINEGYLRTATERLSVLQLAKHISYKLKPGVAASTYMAFSMNEAQGAPVSAIIPVGTKVQSVPEQNQLPQVFETTEQIEAQVVWNSIKLQTEIKFIPQFGDKEIYVKGITTGLQPGDGLLMIGDERAADAKNENWDFRKVKEILPDNDLNITRITWSKGLGVNIYGRRINPAAKNFKIFAFRQKASLFGYNAPEFRVMSEEVRKLFNPDNHNATEWLNLDISSTAGASQDTIYLDMIYPKLVKNSWVLLSTADYNEVYKAEEVTESSRKDFTLTAKTTAINLTGENLIEKFDTHIRDTVIYAQSEELEIADKPFYNAIQNFQRVTLAELMPSLSVGQNIIVSGKRMRLKITEAVHNLLFSVEDNSIATRNLSAGDTLIILQKPEDITSAKQKWTLEDSGGFKGTIEVNAFDKTIDENKNDFVLIAADKNDDTVSELHTINSIVAGTDPTVIVLKDLLTNYFDTTTVGINANVAAATHGETKEETVGSGNPAQPFQKFVLKQKPLAYVSGAGASGAQTTLQVRVNDILWKEVPSFYGVSSKEKVYTTAIADDGKVTIQFGDGVTGAPLPGGTGNVTASYRVGIGSDGLLHAGQLSMLMTPQLGVNKVANPLNTSGAADPETMDKARENAPFTVLTLDRIVSVKDFENFARAFAGIGKACAEVLWNGEQQEIYITIAGDKGDPVDEKSPLYEKLNSAIQISGHTYSTISIHGYMPVKFSVEAGIKTDSNYIFDKVKAQVIEALQQKFSFEKRDFGQDVTLSEIMMVIQSVEGIIYVDVNKLNNQDPFTSSNTQRIVSNLAVRQVNSIDPAQLVTIGEININPIR